MSDFKWLMLLLLMTFFSPPNLNSTLNKSMQMKPVDGDQPELLSEETQWRLACPEVSSTFESEEESVSSSTSESTTPDTTPPPPPKEKSK